MIGLSRSAGDGRNALPRIRRHMSRRSLLVPPRTRSCTVGAEALSELATPDRGDGRDALSRVRRHMSRRSLLVPPRTRSFAIGVEALSDLAKPDRAGARPYVRLRVRTNSGVKVPIGQNTGCP